MELITVKEAGNAVPPPLCEKAPSSLPPRASGHREQTAQEIPDLRSAQCKAFDLLKLSVVL